MIDVEVQQELGRAKNAIQNFLIRKLLVPKIYLDTQWCNEQVDVLAIDRAGVGDAHIVRIMPQHPYFTDHGADDSILVSSTSDIDQSLEKLKAIPAHFRHLAFLVSGSRSKDYRSASRLREAALAADGVGRIGILFVDLNGTEPAVNTIIKPERYRSTPQIIEVTDNYVATHAANWEVRE